MTLESHPSFEPPEQGARLWRYVDLVRLIDLLSTQALFFPSADRLGDPMEGSWTKASLARMESAVEGFRISGDPAIDVVRSVAIDMTRRVMVSCWHESEHESIAMWKLYAQQQGVALVTTVERLGQVLSSYGERIFHIGRVRYIDHYQDETQIDRRSYFEPFLAKHNSLRHEREVRAVAAMLDDLTGMKDQDAHVIGSGIAVPCAPLSLLEEIRLHPGSPRWCEKAIRSIAGKFGVAELVQRSELESQPIF